MTESNKITVTVEIENMTIGDLELLDQAGRNELPASDLVAFLDRIVVEDARSLPITTLPQIVQALQEAVEQSTNPGTAEGN